MRREISRRSFVRRTGAIAGGLVVGGCTAGGDSLPDRTAGALPRRVLGRTGQSVSALTLGTAPSGYGKHVATEEIAEIVRTALDLGVTAVDTARDYDNAETGVGLGIEGRRDGVFLSTKVFADDAAEAETSLAKSLQALRTDHVDLLYLHNVGKRDVDRCLGSDGAFSWLVKQKKAGVCRFVGISGHNTPDRFLPFIETGELDVILAAVNFVDRNTYNFEDRVLATARERNIGFVAMKVYGGLKSGFAGYAGPTVPPLIGEDHMELAVRYAMSLPGVATLNIGVHHAHQIRRNVELVRNARPLTRDETTELERLGRDWAGAWGPHFGPVA